MNKKDPFGKKSRLHVCKLKYRFCVDFSRLLINLSQHQESIAVLTTGRWHTFLLPPGISLLYRNSQLDWIISISIDIAQLFKRNFFVAIAKEETSSFVVILTQILHSTQQIVQNSIPRKCTYSSDGHEDFISPLGNGNRLRFMKSHCQLIC